MKPQPRNGHIEKWLFLVLLYTKFSRLNAKSCLLRSLRSLRALLSAVQASKTDQLNYLIWGVFRDCYVLDLLDLYRRKVIDLYDTCFLHRRAPFYQGKSTIAIDIQLVAESVKFNPSIGFWLIESIEWSSNQSNFPKFFVIDSMSVRLPFNYIRFHSTAIWLYSIYENPGFTFFFLLLLLISLNKK